MPNSLDIALINAEVYTFDDRRRLTEAVGIKGNTIAIVGNNEEVLRYTGKKTRIIDIDDKTILPGFIDAHCHLAFYSMSLKQLDLRDTTSKDQVLQMVQNAAKEKEENQWICVDYLRGWQENLWDDDKTFLSRQELDQVAPENPVALSRIDGHQCSLNSRALEILNIPPDTPGFLFEGGEPTGLLKEPALNILHQRPELEPSEKELVESLKLAIQEAHKLGVTSVHEMFLKYNNKEIKAYQKLKSDNDLNLRVNLAPDVQYMNELIQLGLCTQFGDNKLKLGPVKIFLDGSKSARTAALNEPYYDDPTEQGTLLWEPPDLQKIIEKAHYNDLQVAIHCVGDRASDLALDCFDAANRRYPKILRHRIEHLAVTSHDQIRRARDLNLIVSMQPNFLALWGAPGGDDEHRLGPERYQQSNPYAWVKESGVPLAFGSDVLPFSPLFGIHYTSNSNIPSQKLAPKDAFEAYSLGGAYASFEENLKGSIEEGKLADLIVLTKNPFKFPNIIKDISVLMTIFDGQVVYENISLKS